MPQTWQERYSELTDFITQHPEVEIGASVIRIPDNVRPEFYRLFDMVRTAFVEETFPDLLNESRLLSDSYIKAEKDVVKRLRLEGISTPPHLHRFLHNPTDGLIIGLLEPLFELLKNKIDSETFEKRASLNMQTSFAPLYQSGYEKWVVLSLVRLMEADKSFQVIVRNASREEAKTILRGGLSEEESPPPEVSKRLSFEHGRAPIFTVPDFIVHSAIIERYVAMRSDYNQAILKATNADDVRESYTLDAMSVPGPGLTLLYVDDKPEKASLIADIEKIYRPTLIIECRDQKDWYEKEGLEKINRYHTSLKPTRGTYIVSRYPVPEQAYKELAPELFSNESASNGKPEQHGAEIHILTVGFDQSKLRPIINTLMQCNPKAKNNNTKYALVSKLLRFLFHPEYAVKQ